jgi:hypothetical protein
MTERRPPDPAEVMRSVREYQARKGREAGGPPYPVIPEEQPEERRGDAWERRPDPPAPASARPRGAKPRKTPPGCVPVQEYVPFPVEHMPPPAAQFVGATAAAIGCDPAYVALPALSTLAAAIGTTRALVLKRRWSEPALLWTAAVGQSGSQKSPGYREATDPVFARQRRLMRAHAAASRRAKREGRDEDDGPPPARRVVVSNTTVEKLGRLLSENPRGLLLARDELSGWFGSFTKYKGPGGGSDLPEWLETHRAGTLVIDRKTGDVPTLVVHLAGVSVCGTIQEGTLTRALTAECMDAGLAARLLLAMPPRRRKRWTEDEADPDIIAAWESALARLYALDLVDRPDPDDPDNTEPGPVYLGLSPDAKKLWVEWYDQWAEEQDAAEGELASAFAKIEAYAARLALVHYLTRLADLDCAGSTAALPADSMAAGIALARWFANEARRVYATLGESDDTRSLRRLAEWVRSRGGRASVRQLQRANSRRYRTADEAEEALQSLVDSGLGQWVVQPPPPTGGHGQKEFLLFPTHDTSDTRPGGG